MTLKLFTGGYGRPICKNEQELHLQILYEPLLSWIDKSSAFEVWSLNNYGQRLNSLCVSPDLRQRLVWHGWMWICRGTVSEYRRWSVAGMPLEWQQKKRTQRLFEMPLKMEAFSNTLMRGRWQQRASDSPAIHYFFATCIFMFKFNYLRKHA